MRDRKDLAERIYTVPETLKPHKTARTEKNPCGPFSYQFYWLSGIRTQSAPEPS